MSAQGADVKFFFMMINNTLILGNAEKSAAASPAGREEAVIAVEQKPFQKRGNRNTISRENTLNIRKILMFGILLLSVCVMSCKKDKPKDDDPTNPDNPANTETGLYMGIIGFNKSLDEKGITLLNDNTKGEFKSFINSMGMDAATGLYYAVDNAINMLQEANLPNDLVNVAIVTFTDGLDNVSIDLNSNYASRDAYRDAVSNRIKSTKIKNLPINAYSIGVKGGDVVDVTAFKAGLVALASNPNNAKEVTNMTEVNNTFKEIANSLYNESKTQSIKLRITGGYDDGTKIRFTFDNVTDASKSNLYIEGTYRRNGDSRSLENVVYQGLISSSGTTVSGAITDVVYVTFTFENTSTTSGGSVNTNGTQQWEYIQSESRWQRNSEFGKTGDMETVVDRKSAVIVLVLDCTSSLDAGGANGFSQMKSAANNFIDVLLGNSSGGDGGGTTPTNAQVRFERATAYMYVTTVALLNTAKDSVLAGYGFDNNTNELISPYYQIRQGNHFAAFLNDYDEKLYTATNSYYFQAGHKYTVVLDDDGTNYLFRQIDDGTFSSPPPNKPQVTKIRVPIGDIKNLKVEAKPK